MIIEINRDPNDIEEKRTPVEFFLSSSHTDRVCLKVKRPKGGDWYVIDVRGEGYLYHQSTIGRDMSLQLDDIGRIKVTEEKGCNS